MLWYARAQDADHTEAPHDKARLLCKAQIPLTKSRQRHG